MTRRRPAASTRRCSSSSTAIATAPGRPPISIPWPCCSTASPSWTTTRRVAQEAKKSYDKALDAYSAEKKTPASTRLLCLVDSAVLCADVLGDMKEAKQRLDEVLAASDLPRALPRQHAGRPRGHRRRLGHQFRRIRRPPFHLCQEASRPAPRRSKPKPSAGGARCRALCLEPDGPMEGRGGEQAVPGGLPYSLDQQGGEESLRRDLRLPRSPWHGDGRPLPRQSRCGTKDLQGRRRRNQGGPGRGPAPARRGGAAELPSAPSASGWRNSLERWADCELYSGAASDGKVNLPLAAEYYDQARKIAPEWSDARRDGLQAGDRSRPERQEPGRPGSPRCAGCRQAAGAGGEQGKGHARQAGGRGRARRERAGARRRPQAAPRFSRSVQAQSGLPRFQPPGDHGIATLRRRTAAGFGLGERAQVGRSAT